MGQKTHPIGFRLGVIKNWSSNWFDERNFATTLEEDIFLRRYIRKRLQNAGISAIEIQRTSKRATVIINTAKPGIVIGRKGQEVDQLMEELRRLTNKDVQVNVNEIKRPELDAYLVADNIARQLVAKISFRRAMKRAITATMRMGAQGIKIQCSGRLGGAEMARRESYKDGVIPLHTLRADIDYAIATANTTYGAIGVKVWICKGIVIGSVLD
ncbi:30S ribosomal protein S3 [candidate division KSB1 bacterium]|nr:30S ribosomal protein S3 [Bacteroidota bacterium]MCH8125993.1 30S ribosomal protein S3 [candidate division KSB1 bacterium]